MVRMFDVRSLVVPVAGLAFLIVGCSKSSGSKSSDTANGNSSGSAGQVTNPSPSPAPSPATPPPTGFLSLADIAPPTSVTPLAAADARTALTGNTDFFSNNPDKTTNCVADALNALVLQGTDTTVFVDQTLDLKTCYSKLGSTSAITFTYTAASLHFFDATTCPGGGLAKFVGQTLGKAAKYTHTQTCPGAGSYLFESKGVSSAAYKGTDDNGNAVAGTFAFTEVRFTGQKDLSYCADVTANGLYSQSSPCIDYDLVTTTTQPSGGTATTTTAFNYLASSNIISLDDLTSTWPSSGQYAVTVNNWNGTVTFTSASAPPTYTLTSASGSINGQFPVATATTTASGS